MFSSSGSKIEETLAPYSTFVRCDGCDKTEIDCKSRFKKCGCCNLTFYCSSECQRSAWKLHKSTCAAISSSAAVICAVTQDTSTALFSKLLPKWIHAVKPDLRPLLTILFSTVSPLTHMVLICLKMNHNSDDRVRLSVRSGHIVQAFEMTSARVFTFKEYEGFCKPTRTKSKIRMMMDEFKNKAANPESVAMQFVFRITIEKKSPTCMECVMSTPLTDSSKAQLNSKANNISTVQRAAMSADMSWFVESFKEEMQKHLEMVLCSFLSVCLLQYIHVCMRVHIYV